MTLLYLVTAWTAGILLASTTGTPATTWGSITVAALILAYSTRRIDQWRLAALCIALFALGAARYAGHNRPLPDHHVAHAAGSGYLTLTGIIDDAPDIRDNHINLRINVEMLRQNNTARDTAGRVLIQAPRYGEYAYGDRVRVSGTLLTPPEFDDFSYRDYLARRGIHAMIPNAEVEVLAHDQGSPAYAVMFTLKDRAQETIDRLLPSPQAPLLSGILLGVETGISDDVREAFNRTGTTHVIAISGSNIIVVIGALLGLLTPLLGKKRAYWVTVLGVGGYTLFVGADAAVVRAAIMGTVTIIAAQTGHQAYSPRARQTYGLTALALSAGIMTLWNPNTLWDIGFQLSVAATAGLVLFGNRLNTLLEYGLRRGFANDTARQITRWLSEPLTVSIAAQITTTPLILVYFGRLSIVGLLANILIVPAQPYIMTIGGLATILGMILLPVGQIVVWVAWLPLTYTLEIVRRIGTLELASTSFTLAPSTAWVAYSALLLVAVLVRLHHEDRAALFGVLRQRVTAITLIVAGLIVTFLVWYAAWHQPDGKLHVWFLDVGQGHAVLIQSPNGAQILIDGGPQPTRLRRAIGDELPFWDRGLDMLIVTQPRTSSTAALPALLDHYRVEQVLYTGHDSDSDAYTALVRAWEKHDIDVLHVSAGYRVVTGDGLILEILHPQSPPAPDDDDDTTAMIIRARYGNTSFLIMPVIDEKAEAALVNAGWYAGSTVLELPAHGRAEVNSEAFLQMISPQVGVVGVAAGNRAGLPATETVERLHTLTGQTLYRTDQHGTVEMVTDGDTLWIYTER